MLFTVLEDATLENLNEEGYLLANPDVRKEGIPARLHYETHGKAERRRQYSKQYLNGEAAYRSEKFKRFRDILDLDLRATRASTFPITVGAHHFDVADYFNESANAGFGPFDEEVDTNPDKLYLDIGCGFRSELRLNCLYVEVYPSKTADLIIEPTCLYPIKSSSLDGIGCFAVLEHVRKPWLVVQEMRRMLKPGGKVFIDWPFLQPVHGFPSHFFNATREGLQSIFEDTGFKTEAIGTGRHETPSHTVNWVLYQLFERMPEGPTKTELLKMSVRDLANLNPYGPLWQQAMGELSDSAISEFACGNWLMAIKSGA